MPVCEVMQLKSKSALRPKGTVFCCKLVRGMDAALTWMQRLQSRLASTQKQIV
jgi:hypothetical protein